MGCRVDQTICRKCLGAITPEGKKIRKFGAMTRDSPMLADRLAERKMSHVAMESTGVYWKPVFNVLEDDLGVVVANAHHYQGRPWA